MEMEVRGRNGTSTSENGRQAAAASVGSRTSSPLVSGLPDLPDHIPHERTRLQKNGPNHIFILGSRRAQVPTWNVCTCAHDKDRDIHN